MSKVDPLDDSLDRWVVQRYRFDAVRSERRNVDEVAFDNEPEFRSYIEHATRRLAEEKSVGRAEDVEHYLGHHRPPGYRAAMQRRRTG